MIKAPNKSVYLRALEVTDLDRTLGWHNDSGLYETLGTPFRPVSRQTEEAWLKKAAEWSNNSLSFAVCLVETNAHIGNTYLREIDWISRRGELHLFIGEASERQKGYGQSAVRLLVSYAFRVLGLRRIYLEVLAENSRGVQAYEKCGFRKEGCMTGHTLKNGQFKDVLIMGLNAP